jgi:hypothetical protein
MPELLHECWDGAGTGEFTVVSEGWDRHRSQVSPNLKFAFSLWASSWHEAMQLYYGRLGYGEYKSHGDEDNVYSEEDARQQRAYLKVRKVP